MMTIPQKLQAIQRLSGLSQAALAQKLGVTFAAFNRWINDRAYPRKMAQERIDALFREYAGLTVIPADELRSKKAILKAKAGRMKNVLGTILANTDIRDQFILVLTYTSNRIEGSSLTEAETAAVLFQNTALRNKTLAEQLEAKNHQTALMHLFDHLEKRQPINEDLLLRLHGMLMNGIRQDAGSYRNHGVRIVGADLATANYLTVPTLMRKLSDDLRKQPADVVAHGAEIHARFEKIHPFSDGNGRIGRLLLHAMLLRKNFPPVVVRPERKTTYYSSLNRAQKTEDTTMLQDFLCEGIFEGWNIVERKE